MQELSDNKNITDGEVQASQIPQTDESLKPEQFAANEAAVKKPPKSRNISLVIIVLLVLIILILSVLLLADRLNLSLSFGDDGALDKWEVTSFTNDDTDNDGSGKILINDGTLGEIWINELENVEKNCYNPSGFTDNGSIIEYYVDGEKRCEVGIDVSEFQGNIDWKKVKAAGIDFAMIRIGFRGYGDVGNIVIDENCRANIEGALNAGIKVGGYFFSQSVNQQEAVDEAKAVIDIIKDYDITYPIAFDWEIIGVSAARTDDVSVSDLNKAAVAFCEEIKRAGYTPAVYMSKRIAYLKYDLEALKNYELWLTEDGREATFNYKYDIWQYSYNGKIDGIDGDVDLNISMKSY